MWFLCECKCSNLFYFKFSRCWDPSVNKKSFHTCNSYSYIHIHPLIHTNLYFYLKAIFFIVDENDDDVTASLELATWEHVFEYIQNFLFSSGCFVFVFIPSIFCFLQVASLFKFIDVATFEILIFHSFAHTYKYSHKKWTLFYYLYN